LAASDWDSLDVPFSPFDSPKWNETKEP
jgi:hypothetical protein